MSSGKKGILLLEAVPTGNVEKKVITFLTKFAKNTTPERIAAKVKQLPYVLSKNISAEVALTVVDVLQELGASAVFIPHTSNDTTGRSKFSFGTAERYGPGNPSLLKESHSYLKGRQNGKRRLILMLVLILLLLSLSFLFWQLYPLLVGKLDDFKFTQRDVFVSGTVPAVFFSGPSKEIIHRI